MATNIASLNINLFTRIDAMTAGLRRAQSQIASFGSRVRTISAGVGAAAKRLAAPLAAIGGSASLVALTRGSLNAGDALGKMADQLGVSTEALAAMQFSAGLAGVDSNDLAKSMARLARSSAQAAQGLSEPRRAFDQLGLNAAEIASLPVDQQLLKVAAALSKIENTSQRIDIVQSLFGRGGVSLLSLLSQGEDALRAQAREAENLGLTISRLDAAKFEEANDAVSKIGSAFRGVGNELARAFGPLLEFAANNTTEAVAAMRPVIASIADVVKDVVRGVLLAAALVDGVLQNIGKGIDALAVKFTRVGNAGVGFLARSGAGIASAFGFNTAASGLRAFGQVSDLNGGALAAKDRRVSQDFLRGVAASIDGMRQILDDAFRTSVPGVANGVFDLDDDLPDALDRNTRATESLDRTLQEIQVRGASMPELLRNLREIGFATQQLSSRRRT